MTVQGEPPGEERYLIRGPLPLVVTVLGLGATIAGSIWLMVAWNDQVRAERERVRPTEHARFLRENFAIETRPLVAVDLARFEPLAALPQARALAGEGAELVGLAATGVRRDGTLDLTAATSPPPTVVYLFRRRVAAPPATPPATPGAAVAGAAWYEPVFVTAEAPGRRHFVTRNCCPRRAPGPQALNVEIVNAGLLREPNPPTLQPIDEARPPACPLTLLWQHALARGAPADGLAAIRLERGMTEFRLADGPPLLTTGPDCQPRAA